MAEEKDTIPVDKELTKSDTQIKKEKKSPIKLLTRIVLIV